MNFPPEVLASMRVSDGWPYPDDHPYWEFWCAYRDRGYSGAAKALGCTRALVVRRVFDIRPWLQKMGLL